MRTITVYSISYQQGRSMRTHWTFFATQRQAQEWLDASAHRLRSACGPLKHVLAGQQGIVSMLNTYST